jgi:dTDP-4-amino-4,6-dideoxy-D-galactose acyltransferase
MEKNFMYEKFKNLSYDSQLFGYKVAELININDKYELLDILRYLKENNYKLCYYFVENDFDEKNKWIESCNGYLIDVKVTLRKSLVNVDVKDNEIKIYESHYLSDDLISLALQSGSYSRYKRDKLFVNNEFYNLYYDWIRKSVDYVLIYENSNKIVGMATIKINMPDAVIGLIAVDNNFKGKGIGRKLLQKVDFIAKTNMCEKIIVSTQELNVEALNFYQKNMYEIFSKKYVYHFWL